MPGTLTTAGPGFDSGDRPLEPPRAGGNACPDSGNTGGAWGIPPQSPCHLLSSFLRKGPLASFVPFRVWAHLGACDTARRLGQGGLGGPLFNPTCQVGLIGILETMHADIAGRHDAARLELPMHASEDCLAQAERIPLSITGDSP